MKTIVSPAVITHQIFLLRNQKVMIDRDLAILYGVPTKVLNQAVKRNAKRFPPDFKFQLTEKETKKLVTICDRFKILKHSSVRPHAFTEQGVAMLSSVLNSERAVQVNIEIMRAFVYIRKVLATHKSLARKLKELEYKYDGQFKVVFDSIGSITS